jgi:hypothetical protein
MKSGRNRFLPQAADRRFAQGRLPLAERPARHLKWSAAITGAFLGADGLPRWRPATFTLGLRAKRMLSLICRVLNFRLSWLRLEQNVAVTKNTLAQPVLSGREGRSPSRDQDSRSLAPRGVPLVFPGSHLRQTFSHVEKISEHRIWLQGPTGARQLWIPQPPSTMSPGMRRHATRQEASAAEMTTRIMRRLRRVEAPISVEPRLASGSPGARVFEAKLERPARKLHHDLKTTHSSELGASVAVPPGLNVMQLTDEVMRQIDRRLVAVRERMGKI